MIRAILASLLVLLSNAALADRDKWDEYIKGLDEPVPHAVGPGDPGSATQNSPQLDFVQWRDPQEGSFTVDVPAGWQIEGGVKWNTIFSPRQWVKARNPEHTSLIFIGDPDLLPRFVPNLQYDQLGWRAGSEIQNTAGTRVLMDVYRPGELFAFAHAGTVCNRPQNLGTYRLNDETAALSRALEPFSQYLSFTITSGETYFSCGGFDGYIHAVTLLAGQRGGTGVENWDILAVDGFSALNPRDYEIAHQAYLRMTATFQIDAQWRDSVNQHLGTAAGIMTQASAAMEHMALESAQNAMDAHTRIVNKWSNIILGQEHRCTDAGDCQMTSNRCDYVWKNRDGMFCGPSDGSPPPLASGPWQPTHIAP